MKLKKGNLELKDFNDGREYLIQKIEYDINHEYLKHDYDITFEDFYDRLISYGLSYDEVAAIVNYFSSFSYVINDALLRGEDGKYESQKNTLDKALKKLPCYEGILFRGIDIDIFDNTINDVLKIFDNSEQIGHWNMYLSSSDGLYSHTQRLQFIIKSKSARNTFDLKKENNSREFIFERNVDFHYVDAEIIKINNIEYLFVYIEEV